MPPNTPLIPDPESHVEATTWPFSPVAVAFLCSFLTLIIAMAMGRFLQRKKISWMSDAGVAILAGILMGGLFKLGGGTHDFGDLMTFKFPIFFYVLMPMIMWFGGYTLSIRPFLLNYDSISLAAFLGTAISSVIVAVIMWAAGAMGWCYEMHFGLNFAFGAMISATDPVAVVAIFHSLGANEDLYMNVFGESVFNDAVGLVMYNCVKNFIISESEVSVKAVMSAVGIFIGIFVGSALLGAAIAFLASLVFRTGFFNPMLSVQSIPSKARPIEMTPMVIDPSPTEDTGNVEVIKHAEEEEVVDQESSIYETATIYETAVVIGSGLCSYMSAVALGLSGITSIVVAGMIMSCYVAPNLSPTSQERVREVSMVIAVVFELFTFVYIGITAFLAPLPFFQSVSYIAISLFAIGISRAIHLYPICALVNFLRLEDRQIDYKTQFMMWWVGLRGPVAFALSLDAADSFGEAGKVMKTTVLAVTIITVYVNGGASAYLLQHLRLRTVDNEVQKKEETVTLLTTDAAKDDLDQNPLPHFSQSPSRRFLAAVREFNSGAFVESIDKVDSMLASKFARTPSTPGYPPPRVKKDENLVKSPPSSQSTSFQDGNPGSSQKDVETPGP